MPKRSKMIYIAEFINPQGECLILISHDCDCEGEKAKLAGYQIGPADFQFNCLIIPDNLVISDQAAEILAGLNNTGEKT